jgi:heme/copper-type cytochrome/quinol oxidase subunit 3
MSDVALPGTRVRPSGWWGMALFVAAEATLFGTLFGTYFYLRFNAVHWPPRGIDAPSATLPLILTAALVATSVVVQAALAAARNGRPGRAGAALFLALAVQCGYLATHLVLFAHDLDKFRPGGSAYASIYFTLLGAHDAHVVVGLALELWLVVRLMSGLSRYRLIALQTTAFYWHFVNLLAVLVVAAQLSPAV